VRRRFLVLAALPLAACASHPQSPAAAANAAACTQAADQAYQNSTLNLQGRTLQNGLRYGGPNEVFQGERLGAENDRSLQIAHCEEYGTLSGPPVPNTAPAVTPHIAD
jgi:hypothetical protein